MNENKFDHNLNRYDRPDFPYKCGRGVLWLKQCHQGPTLKGLCGGTTECSPYIDNDQWICNRPLIAGGPCEEGPSVDGKCCKRHPPCVPKHSLRVYRKRLSILAVGFIFALIAASWVTDQLQKNYYSFDAGPISSSHISFVEKDGCQVCHVAHDNSGLSWLKAAVTEMPVSSKCGDCHTFGGPEFIAHNGDIKKEPRLQKTHCLMCHREHRGEEFSTRKFTNQQCNFCHKEQFNSFSVGHPEFPRDYPHAGRDSIKFSHITHLEKYFLEPKHSRKAPIGCIGCHKLVNEQSMDSGKFEEICAACHESQILSKDLVLLRLPELDKNRIDRKTVMKACGIQRGSPAAGNEDEEFLSISTDTPSLTTAYLLNIPEDDPTGYSQKLQDLIVSLAKESTMPIAKLIDAHSPMPISEKMLAGLNPEVIKRAACAWGLNLEYDPPAKASFGGWYADLLEVRYTPVNHKDPVALSWIKFALDVPQGETDGIRKERAIAMRDQMLSSKEGVGGCMKCHTIDALLSEDKKETLSVHWGYRGFKSPPYTQYSHKSHMDVVRKGDPCQTCHVLNKESTHGSSSNKPGSNKIIFNKREGKPVGTNFNSITRSTCAQCHTSGKVRQDCQLCHLYHLEPDYKGNKLLAEIQPKRFQ
jgi:hypothetical protein